MSLTPKQERFVAEYALSGSATDAARRYYHRPGIGCIRMNQSRTDGSLHGPKGKEIEVTSRGKVIARIVAGGDPHQEAREPLLAMRKH